MKQKIVSKIEKKKFYWRLIGLITVSIFLILDLHWTIIGRHVNPGPFLPEPTERLSVYYSYFTTQTNYLVLIYLFAILWQKKVKPLSEPNYYIMLAVTVYITLTMIVFWAGIIVQVTVREQYGYNIYFWFKTVILHLIMPIVMITNYCLVSGKKLYEIKKHHELFLWYVLIYPIFYLTYVLIRGSLRYNSGFHDTAFPYEFLNYKVHGIGSLIITILLIFFIIVILQYLFILINNLRYHKKQKIITKDKFINCKEIN